MKKLAVTFLEQGVKVGWDEKTPVYFKFPFKMYKMKLSAFDKKHKIIKYRGTTSLGESVLVEFHVREYPENTTIRVITNVEGNPNFSRQYSAEF